MRIDFDLDIKIVYNINFIKAELFRFSNIEMIKFF